MIYIEIIVSIKANFLFNFTYFSNNSREIKRKERMLEEITLYRVSYLHKQQKEVKEGKEESQE